MPYLEPFLIDAVREASREITDPQLAADARGYVGQGAHHFKQHRKLNDLLLAKGYERLRDHERVLAADYDRLARRPLEFRLAYAAGFETMALAIGHLLVRHREYCFAGADPSVSSLVLRHFVEELEHKRAAFDVYQHVVDRYPLRVWGLVAAMAHTLARTRQPYVVLLQVDGRWGRRRTRWEIKKLMVRIVASLTPRLLERLLPRHDPARIPDPDWVQEWLALYERGETGLTHLDTRRMHLAPTASRTT